eukprot:SAG31_NODE_1484_length_8160_cov_5.766778_2_plen_48_part_00
MTFWRSPRTALPRVIEANVRPSTIRLRCGYVMFRYAEFSPAQGSRFY